MSKPKAEIELTVEMVRELMRVQHPDLCELPLREVSAGWDNFIFRLGDTMAVRLPRREAAAQLLENEQRWLPYLQSRLTLPIPEPLCVGVPQGSYPWRWSITPWIEGETADLSPPRGDQARVLAAFFEQLHTLAPPEAPHNPYRSVSLAQRQPIFSRRVAALERQGRRIDAELLHLWSLAITCPIDVPRTWIHADLHSHNVLVSHGDIAGIIDWGDVAQGDRATDLAAVWMLFPEAESRKAVVAGCRSVSKNTWQRARGWALLLSLAVLEAGDQDLAGAALLTMQRLLEPI